MPAEFDYGTLAYADRVNVHEALAATTMKHIQRASGLFVPLRYAPEDHPSQLLETVELLPSPTTFEENRFFTDAANPHLAPFIREKMVQDVVSLNKARQALKEGRHITKVTTHLKIDDIAYEQAAWDEISEMEEWQERNGLIVARGVTTIGAFDMAISEIMQKAGHVFLSFPRTTTMEGVDIDPNLINTNNLRMRRAIKEWFMKNLGSPEDKSKVLHTAWEGKTAEIKYGDNHKPERVKLAKVNNAYLRLAPDLTEPMVIWDGEEPAYEVGELTTVRSRADIDRVQEWQRGTLARILGLSDEAVTIAA